MAHAPRPRRPLLVAVAALFGLGVLGFGALAAAASTGSGPLTVTFHSANGNPCGTEPNHVGLTVPEGTGVQFLNRTGRDGAIVVGEQEEPVKNGSGVELLIAVGQYDVRLVSDCGSVSVSSPVSVIVTASGSAPTTTSAGATRPTGNGTPGDTQNVGAANEPTPTPRPGGTPSAVVGADPAPTTDAAASARSGDPSPVLAATPVALDDAGGNPKDVRLLAAVAAICVLGVTAAIIRSIVRLSP